MLVRMELAKVSLPPQETARLFHQSNFLAILSTFGCLFVGLPPRGILRLDASGTAPLICSCWNLILWNVQTGQQEFKEINHQARNSLKATSQVFLDLSWVEKRSVSSAKGRWEMWNLSALKVKPVQSRPWHLFPTFD